MGELSVENRDLTLDCVVSLNKSQPIAHLYKTALVNILIALLLTLFNEILMTAHRDPLQAGIVNYY